MPRKRVIDYQRPVKKEGPKVGFFRETVVLFLVVLSIFLLASLCSYVFELSRLSPVPPEPAPPVDTNVMGQLGQIVSRLLYGLLGWCAFVIPFWSVMLARSLWLSGRKDEKELGGSVIIPFLGSILAVISCAVAASVIFSHQGGGLLGVKISEKLVGYINEAGALLVSIAVLILAVGFVTGFGALGTIKLARNLFLLIAKAGRSILSTFLGMFYLLKRGLPGLKLIYWLAFKLPASLALKVLGSSGNRLITFKPQCDKAHFSHSIGNSCDDKELEFVFSHEDIATEKNTEKENLTTEIKDNLANLKIFRRDGSGTASNKGGKRGKFLSGKKVIKEALAKRKAKKDRKKLSKEERKTPPPPRFELPPLDLLVSSEVSVSAGPNDDELVRNSRRLEKALFDFKIGGKIVEVHPGPVITLYQFEPAAGVKVQRIITLADDLALALKVGSVRVYAPVPGKGTVGIEVPNAEREIVRLKDILGSSAWQNIDSVLSLALGKDTFGEPYVADLSKMPHLLIAGATGTGKSVCINSLLLSLLYRNSPEDLRLIMIDPKMLELSIYEDIPHLKAPVVTNPKRARAVLWWVVEEMERRYRLMKEHKVRGIVGYNKLVCGEGGELNSGREAIIELEEENVVAASASFNGELMERKSDDITRQSRSSFKPTDRLPRIVVVVDELADLILTVGREVEDLLTRLAQKARAAGIHLILATQRPSVNVITGLIKANFPARISFKVATRIDSRTVLDTSGADKLLGMGDMLLLIPGGGRLRRLHSAFVSDREVQDVVSWIKRQGAPDYDPDIEKLIEKLESNERGEGASGVEFDEYDPFYDQAVNLVVEKGYASTSMVQRAFRIGYNRAARILEIMERDGLVGPADGSKPRTVMVPDRQI